MKFKKILIGVSSIGIFGMTPIIITSCSKNTSQIETEQQKSKITSSLYNQMIARRADKFTKTEGEKWNKRTIFGDKYLYWNLESTYSDFEWNINFISSGMGILSQNSDGIWSYDRYSIKYTLPTLRIEKTNLSWVEGGLLVQSNTSNSAQKSLSEPPKPQGHYILKDVYVTNYYENGEFKQDWKSLGDINVYSVLNRNDIRPEYEAIQKTRKAILGEKQLYEYNQQQLSG